MQIPMKTLAVVLAMCMAAFGQGAFIGGTSSAGGTSTIQGGSGVSVSSLAVTPSASPTQNVGQSLGLTATVTLSDGSKADVTAGSTWTSSNLAIGSFVSLTATENVICNSAGTVLFTANYGNASGSIAVTCVANLPPVPTPVSLAIGPTSPSTAQGTAVYMIATETMSDGSTPDVTASAVFTSGDTSVAVVHELQVGKGREISCVGNGSSVITITNDGLTSNTTLTCTAVLSSIVVTPATPTIVAGNTQQFIATCKFTDGSSGNCSNPVWASGTPATATVSQSGLAFGLAAGTSSISATLGAIGGNTTLTVTNPGPPPPTQTGTNVGPPTPTINVGSTFQFQALETFTDGSTKDCTATAIWASTVTATATITSVGLATGVAAGTTTIQATCNGFTGTDVLTVQAIVPTLSSIAVTPPSPTQYNGSTVQFTATGTYSDGSQQDLTSQATWTSGTLSVATIAGNTAKCVANSGTSVITATLGAASGSQTLTCQAATTNTGENVYEMTSGTWIGPTTDGPATLPTSGINTALSNTPSPGATVTVAAGNFSDLQAKINAATCGETIVVPALAGLSQAIYTGQLVIPATSCALTQWITVETDKIADLPAEGSRISPAWVGITSLPGRPAYAQPGTPGMYLPKLIASTTVMKITAGAKGWRFIGIEFTTTAGTNIFDTITANNVDSIIFDRVLIHGGNSSTWQDKDNIAKGINFGSSRNTALINSYVGDVHCISNGTCTDSMDVFIGGTGGVTDGPHKVYNNFLEAAGESIFTGGNGIGSGTISSTDDEIRNNHTYKPLFWKLNDSSYFGTNFIIKNALEFKNTQRALIEGNIFENDWAGQSDQFGTLIELGSKNQSVISYTTASSNGSGTLTRISGANFPSTVTSPGCATPNHCMITYNSVSYQAQSYIDANHITVSPNPPTISSASAKVCQPGVAPTAIVSNVTLRYNQISHASRGTAIFAAVSDCGDFSEGDQRISIHDNVQDDLDGYTWSTSGGACCAWSSGYQIQNAFNAPNYLQHIWIKHNTTLERLTSGSAGYGPSLGFGFQTGTTGGVTDLQITDNISAAGFSAGTKGVCSGSGISTLATLQCWDQLSGVPQNSFCFDHNVLATTTATTGATTKTLSSTPYPAAGQSPGCSFTTSGNPTVASYDVIGFTSLNGAIGGNYQLLSSSPWHNAGSDGKDIGADIVTLNGKIAGAR
jgi:Bacterial Ig-like domain (group 2)